MIWFKEQGLHSFDESLFKGNCDQETVEKLKNLRVLIDKGMDSGPPIENFDPKEF